MIRHARRYPRFAMMILAVLGTTSAQAQAQGARPPARPGAPAAPADAGAAPYRSSFADLPAPHSSILRERPWHEEFVPDSQRNASYGVRNPGGVGRFAEYYPPGNRFQNDSPAHITARTGVGGGAPTLADQRAAQAVGTARYSALQTHIDTYGRPMMGFGLGFGFGW